MVDAASLLEQLLRTDTQQRRRLPLALPSTPAQELQGQLQALDLAAPALVDCALPAGQQVGFELVEPGQHFGLTDSIGHRTQASLNWP
jgi:hypothetical protein